MNWDDLPVSKDQVTVLALVAALVASAVLAPAMAGLGGPDLESGTANTETPDATEAPREGTSYTASSDGMDDVPESYVVNDIGGVVAPNVSTSAGSQTMQVDASGTADRPQLTLTDDQNHEGRVVAIDVSWFKQTIGHVPELAYVAHESGNTYASPISVEGGKATFAVHEFSTNTITFDGERRINAQPADDGATFTYNMSSNEDVQNFTIDLTGSRNKAWNNTSATGAELNDSRPVTIGGTTDPVGDGTNGEPTVTMSAKDGHVEPSEFASQNLDSYFLSSTYASEVELTTDGANGRSLSGFEMVASQNTDTDVSGVVDVYVVEEEADGVYGEGTLVKSGWEINNVNGGDTVSTTFDQEYDSTSNNVTLEFVIQSGFNGDIRMGFDDSTSANWHSKDGTLNSQAGDFKVNTVEGTASDVKIEADDGTSQTVGNLSLTETKTVDFPVSKDATQINVTGSGTVNYELDLQEVTDSVDPSVELNGEVAASYSGTLADGETVSIDANESLVQSGTNTVNVTVSDVSGGPIGMVGMDYSHTAPETRSVDYTAEAFSERYSVSKTWEEDTDNATLRIPWASDRVIGLRDVQVEYYDDTGSLSSSTSNPDYYFDGGDLVVELGDVPAGWETVVDADGTKVQVENGNITVLEPTAKGSTLDSKITIDDKSSGFYIAVGGTDEGNLVHYLHNESWSGADGYAEFDASGNQHVYLPNAAAGSETRLRTLPVEFAPVTGDLQIRIPEDRVNENEPVYKVSPGASDGDEYDVTFVEASDGEDYVLYDETNGIALDSGTASSPLTLSDDNDDEAIIQFQLDDDTSSSSDGGGSSGDGGGAGIFDGGDSRNTGFLVVVAVVLAVLAFIARGDESPVREAGDDIADSVEGASERVPIIGPLVGGAVASATRAVSQGASALLNNRDAAVLLGAGVVLGAIQTGVIDLGPQDTAIVGIVIASLGSLIGLRRLDEFTFNRWAVINAIVGVVALQAVGEEAVLTAIVNSDVFPLIAIAGVVLLYRTIQGFRESQQEPDQNIVIQANTESDD